MITKEQEKNFLKYLSEKPSIKWAAEKAGIHRSTIHRHMNTDKKFNRQVGRSKEVWRNDLVADAEAGLADLVKDKKWPAIRYILEKYTQNTWGVKNESQLGAKFSELAPDLEALYPMPPAPFDLHDLYGTKAVLQQRNEETKKFLDKAPKQDAEETEEFVNLLDGDQVVIEQGAI